jgi:hypothetical protein
VSERPIITVDRRVTLQWLFGAVAASGLPLQGAYAAAAPAPWPEPQAAPGPGPGYGTDPPLLEPVVPWPKTLSAAQLGTVGGICDTILPPEGAYPAPSAIGIQHFVDEWVSAPYPEQVRDRALLLPGFAWVEAEAQARHAKGFAKLDEAARTAILTEATNSQPKGGGFVERMKFLTAGAYYTSEPGIAEIGYVGNEPLEGDYPGPTPEAFAHLDQLLASLKLSRKT